MTEKKPPFRRAHKAKKVTLTQPQLDATVYGINALADVATDLRAAIAFTLSPDFPPPNEDSDRIAWLRAWWQGEQMRQRTVAEEPPPAKEDSQ